MDKGRFFLALRSEGSRTCKTQLTYMIKVQKRNMKVEKDRQVE